MHRRAARRAAHLLTNSCTVYHNLARAAGERLLQLVSRHNRPLCMPGAGFARGMLLFVDSGHRLTCRKEHRGSLIRAGCAFGKDCDGTATCRLSRQSSARQQG